MNKNLNKLGWNTDYGAIERPISRDSVASTMNGCNEIIDQYLKEHHFIYGLSEPLNWESQWVAPEYRIGT